MRLSTLRVSTAVPLLLPLLLLLSLLGAGSATEQVKRPCCLVQRERERKRERESQSLSDSLSQAGRLHATWAARMQVMASQPSECLLPADMGRCRASFVRWHFNASTLQCSTFVYGGCEGNANRFDTLEACKQR
jgi:hypothetical protein